MAHDKTIYEAKERSLQVWAVGELSPEGKLLPVTLELIGEGRKLAGAAGQLTVVLPCPREPKQASLDSLLHRQANQVILLQCPGLSP